MDWETKKLVAPVFNHFYEKYDVSHHEEMKNRKGCTKRSVAIVKGYKEGKKAVLDYIENGGLPLCLYSKEELMEVFEKAFLSVVEINTYMKISDNKRDILSDTCVYLKYYEDSIVKNNDKSMLPFCADIALKRLFLVDESPFPFQAGYRDEVLSDIEKHVLEGRCTDNTKAKYERYIKPYLDKKRAENK